MERRVIIKPRTVIEYSEMASTMVNVQCGGCGKLTKAKQTEIEKGDPVYCTDCLVYTNCGLCEDQLVLNQSKFETLARNPVCLDCSEGVSTSSPYWPIIQPGNGKGTLSKYSAIITGGFAVVFTLMSVAYPVMLLVGPLTGVCALSFGLWHVWKAEIIHEIWIAGSIATLSGISLVISVFYYSQASTGQVLLLIASGFVFLKHAINWS